LNSYSI